MRRIDFILLETKVIVRYLDATQTYFLRQITDELQERYNFDAIKVEDAKQFDDLTTAKNIVNGLVEGFEILESKFI